MSTANFAYKNILYVADCDEQWQYDDLRDNLQDHLNSVKWNKYKFNDTIKPENNDRDYAGEIIGELIAERYFGEVFCSASIQVIIRAGYYSGVNVDLNYVFTEDCEDFEDYHDFNKVQMRDWAGNFINRYAKKVEKIIAQHTQKIRHVATFSNGEAVYERA